MTNTELKNEIASIKKELSGLKALIDPFKTGGRKLITEAEIKKADNNLKKI